MMMDKTTSARIANVSILAALAVVLLHIVLEFPPAQNAAWLRVLLRDFGRFAVPFFFMVSGFLLARHVNETGWWQRETVKRLYSLLVPYFIWSALFGAYLLSGTIVQEMRHVDTFDWMSWWIEKRGMLFGTNLLEAPLMLPLWFLRTLLLLVLLSSALVAILRRRAGRYILLGTFALIHLGHAVVVDMCPSFEDTTLGALMRFTLVPEAFFYFTLGLLLRGPCPNPPRGYGWGALLVGLGLCLGRQLGFYVPYPLIVPFLICGMWGVVPVTPWPRAFTSLAFPVYLMHWFFVHILSRSRPQTCDSTLAFLAVFVIISACCLLWGWTLRKIVPRVASGLFGGR